MYLADIPLAEGDIPPSGSMTVPVVMPRSDRRALWPDADISSEPMQERPMCNGPRAHASARLANSKPPNVRVVRWQQTCRDRVGRGDSCPITES